MDGEAPPVALRSSPSEAPGPGAATSAAASQSRAPSPGVHRVVIVGGGAGGLPLAVLLGRLQHPRHALDVTLVDAQLTHVWKPQLHELAAGTLRGTEQEVDFVQQARRHGFRFQLGRLSSIDRRQRTVQLEPLVDDDGREVAPRRQVGYDTLVLALGSIVNDFGTPGVREHAMSLDSADDARRFHRRFLAACARAEWSGDAPVSIVIVGGGATGVELAAELTEAATQLAHYGERIGPRPVQLHIVEGSGRLVGQLPAALSDAVLAQMQRDGVDVRLGERVTAVEADAVRLASGDRLPADITVWAAGIRGTPVMRELDGLELTRSGQLELRPSLQTSLDDDIYGLGDCGHVVPPGEDSPVPARAQAAFQQAQWLVDQLTAKLDGKAAESFHFDDRGALVSLGSRDAVGRVSAGPTDQALNLRGATARWAYWALQRRHMATLHGWAATVLATIGGWLVRRAQPRVKLH